MDGKKTLFQRVLTRPGAALSAKPGDPGGKPLPAFTLFYVYERAQQSGKSWLLLGGGTDGKTQGWLPDTDGVAWQHMISVAFAAPSGRERVLFLRSRDALNAHLQAADPAAETQRLLKEIASKGTLGPTHPVIAAEPDKVVDLRKSFYLLPVLESGTVRLKTGHNARALRIASVTRDAAVVAPTSAAPSNEGIANFNSAVVFVIDATSSMQTYIDQTRRAMEEVLNQADAAKLGNRLRFGLVAFQDDPAKTKGVDYLAKVFADPTQVSTREQFMAAMAPLKATPNSTRAYAEDAYAGLDTALRSIQWNRFGGRYVVFITDASAREGSSPLASSRLGTKEMRSQARERGVAIYALHLKTPEGRNDHSIAERQYTDLTQWPGRGSLYFPVEAGDPTKFGSQIKRMAESLMDQVRAPQKILEKPAAAPTKGDALQQTLDDVGRAMVLSYLGREQGVKSPPLYEAWTFDRDVRNGEIPSLSVRVLLNKNQLSDLQATVRRLADAYDKTQLDPATVFDQLRSAAAALGRDPSLLAQGKARNLEQAGLMAEFLEGLPYRSPVMSLSLSDWANYSTGQRQVVIDRLRALAVLYQRYHDDVDRWVKLNDAASDGDRVYPVAIDDLP